MLLAFALAAATHVARAEEPDLGRYYVADAAPTKALKLDEKAICTQGFLDPAKLVLQITVQLELYDALRTKSAEEAALDFDGVRCVEPQPGDTADQTKGYCNGAKAVQRMLLGVYPGFYPVRRQNDEAPETARLLPDDLGPDVADLTPASKARVVAFAKRVLASKASDYLVQCDFTPSRQVADGASAVRDTEMKRDSFGAGAAEFGVYLNRLLKYSQFRQAPSNLAYRGDLTAVDVATTAAALGRDLYATDAGFKLSYSRAVGDEANEKGFQRTRKASISGAIGFPICSIAKFDGKPCQPSDAFNFDAIPYVSRELESSRKTGLEPPKPEEGSPDKNQWEYGAVIYGAWNRTNYGCLAKGVFGDTLKDCGHYVALRSYRIDNRIDHSRLYALSGRYTPLIKTDAPGFDSFEFCLNALCGEPDQIMRWGFLGDLRLLSGWFDDRGQSTKQILFNEDYVRAGGRVGAMTVVNLLPNATLTVWGAYSRFATFSGFDKRLDMVQTQASLDFQPLTVSLEWRNGRREDTAKRDSTVSVSLGFKTK